MERNDIWGLVTLQLEIGGWKVEDKHSAIKVDKLFALFCFDTRYFVGELLVSLVLPARVPKGI